MHEISAEGTDPAPHVCVDVDASTYTGKSVTERARVVRRSERDDPSAPASARWGSVRGLFEQGRSALVRQLNSSVRFMAVASGKRWYPGRTLRIAFLNGTQVQRQRTFQHAREWEAYANIRFVLATTDQAEIRIGFGLDTGSWSLLGTDALSAPRGRATMNFGWLYDGTDDREYNRTVVHEFGHALGCIHEHQNPAGGIPWNRPAVYAFYAGPPNYWSPAQVDVNVFQTYDRNQTNYTRVDPWSIMMYPIPPAFTLTGFSVGMNADLSPTDKAFIRTIYP